MNFDISHFNLTSSKENAQQLSSPKVHERYQSSLCEALFSNDAGAVKSTKILAYKHKAPAPSESFQNQMRTLYSANKKATLGSSTSVKHRQVPTNADKVLDAPGIRDDYYLNLLEWSVQNTLAVALDRTLYLWNATTSEIDALFEMEEGDDYITSVSWMGDGNILSVGMSTYSSHSRQKRNI